MDTALLKIEIKYEHDVVLARQRARQTAALLGFESQDQVRIATAVSELARNAFQYAGGGRVEFSLSDSEPQRLQIRVRDHGPGIADLPAILGGQYVSRTGMGLGIIGVRRLMDEFDIASQRGDTGIEIAKYLPRKSLPVGKKQVAELAEALARQGAANPFQEIQRQNQELLEALDTLERQRTELAQLNRELEETNRGVVALYAELDERADYLKRASEIKSEFLSNMTHEFRTPLNSILSISQMLLSRLDGELTSEQEKQVRFIQAGATNLSELVNDLLDLAKVEAGKVVVRPAAFEVGAMFGTLRGMLKPLLEHNSSITLIIEEPQALPPMLTDEGKLSQILRNFISNGLKYTERGEVRVTAAQRLPQEITFSVSDTGIGIAAEDQMRIFEEFTQVENKHQKKIKGTGLGLPLSKKLAELLGGSVSVESAPGRGSVFSVTIPVTYRGPAEAQLVPQSSAGAPPKPRILIIDDSEADRYVLRRMLNELNHSATETTSGEEGLRKARELHPDLIFLDMIMPGLTGFEVLEELKSDTQTRAIPVIAHTSKSLSAEERDFLEAHTLGILAKDHTMHPASLRQMQSLIARVERREAAYA